MELPAQQVKLVQQALQVKMVLQVQLEPQEPLVRTD
jgi:hypothetical protein